MNEKSLYPSQLYLMRQCDLIPTKKASTPLSGRNRVMKDKVLYSKETTWGREWGNTDSALVNRKAGKVYQKYSSPRHRVRCGQGQHPVLLARCRAAQDYFTISLAFLEDEVWKPIHPARATGSPTTTFSTKGSSKRPIKVFNPTARMNKQKLANFSWVYSSHALLVCYHLA